MKSNAGDNYLDEHRRSTFDKHSAYLETYGAEWIIPEMDLPRSSSRRHLPDTLRIRLAVSDPALDEAV